MHWDFNIAEVDVERDSLRDYLGVKEAADFVGVSPATIRNWERAGKITARRNPMNGYRLFRRSELEQLLADIEHSDSGSSESATNDRCN